MILVIETSAAICSAALASSDGKCVAVVRAETENSHAEKLPVMVAALLEDHQLKAQQLAAVGINCGPGSYTGLRIGTSLVKGICYATGIPMLSLNGFLGMAGHAKQFHPADRFLVNLDARRNEFYLETFDKQLRPSGSLKAVITYPTFLTDYQESEIVVCGNANEKIQQNCDPRSGCYFLDMMPDASYLCEEAAEKLKNGMTEDVAYFEPRYLKEFVPGVPKKFAS